MGKWGVTADECWILFGGETNVINGLWWRLYNSVNTLKTIHPCILKGSVVQHGKHISV